MLIKLRGKRVEHGYTQAQFAELVGISLPSYRLKECGEIDFRMKEINKILELLNCTYEDIFFQKEVNKTMQQ